MPVKANGIFKLITLFRLLAVDGFEEFLIWQVVNAEDGALQVARELLEVITFELNSKELIPIQHCSICSGDFKMLVDHPGDLASNEHQALLRILSFFNLDSLFEFTC